MAKQPDQDADLGAAGSSSELDQYGVFVKSGPREVEASSADEVSLSDIDSGYDSLDLDTGDGGLPDLDDLSFTDDLGADDVTLELPPDVAPRASGGPSGSDDDDSDTMGFDDSDLSEPDFDSIDLGDDDEDDEVQLNELPMDELDLEDELADAGDSGFMADVTPAAMDSDLPDTVGDIGFGGVHDQSPGNAEPDVDEITLDELDTSTSAAAEDDLGFDDVAAVTDDFSTDFGQSDDAEQDPFAGDQGYGGPAGSAADGHSRAQLEDELRSIREELAALRREMAELRTTGIPSSGATPPRASSPSADMLDLDDAGGLAPGSVGDLTESGPGFFEDDEDDTIALTAGELDNILNNAELTETSGEGEELDEDLLAMGGMGAEDQPGPGDEDDTGFIVSDIDLEPMDEPAMGQSDTDDSDFFSDAADDEDSLDLDEEFELPDGSADSVQEMASIDIDRELEDIGELGDDPGLEASLESFPATPDLDIDDDEIARVAGGDIGAIDDPGMGAVGAPDADVAELAELDAEDPMDSADEVREMTGASRRVGPPAQADVDEAELKDVLKIMDTLLDDLPEDKVREFANSEHFEVYKKLFDQLGI